jgi:hypothetical protein
MMAIAFCLFSFVTSEELVQAQTIAPRSEAASQATEREQFTAELKKLRSEVLQIGIEFQSWKIKQLERELQQVLREQDHLTQQENAIQQRIAELTEQAETSLPTEEGAVGEAEVVKNGLIEKGLNEVQTRRQPLTERAAELTRQLNQEGIRLQELINKTKQLQAEN